MITTATWRINYAQHIETNAGVKVLLYGYNPAVEIGQFVALGETNIRETPQSTKELRIFVVEQEVYIYFVTTPELVAEANSGLGKVEQSILEAVLQLQKYPAGTITSKLASSRMRGFDVQGKIVLECLLTFEHIVEIANTK